MIHEVMHIGITVSDLERSIRFYRDILGLAFRGGLLMEGEETDLLFARKGCKVAVAYLNGSDEIFAPPIELLEFADQPSGKALPSLFQTSISEICFRIKGIDAFYEHLSERDVQCLSRPCFFDFTSFGFGKSKAFYFRDPDGNVLEAMEALDE